MSAEITQRSLVKKLSEVMGEVERIAKNGRNDHFNYDFATEADISEAVRGHMAARHLLLVPSVEKTEWEVLTSAKGAPKKICTLTVQYTLMDGDSGEEMKFTILGQGEDSGDKATYKAMTGATKFALMKLFLIPTGNDPEKDGENRYTPTRSHGPEIDQRPTAIGRATGGEPIRDKSTTVKFGKTKGKFLCDIPDEDLAWQLTAAKKSADANDPKWGASNKVWLQTVQAETVRRLGMGAPPAGDPAPAPVAPGNWQKIVELGALFGKTEAQMKSFCSSVLPGKTKLTAADVQTVQAALSATAKPLDSDELPLYPGVG
jgi:hypothetical protein